MSTHTPWSYTPNINIGGPDGRELARTIVHCPEGPHWEKRWVDEAADNAEFIVQAVNAHEDLLAAVRAILDEVSGEYDGWAKDAVSVLRIREIAQAAIAAATGGTP